MPTGVGANSLTLFAALFALIPMACHRQRRSAAHVAFGFGFLILNFAFLQAKLGIAALAFWTLCHIARKSAGIGLNKPMGGIEDLITFSTKPRLRFEPKPTHDEQRRLRIG